MKLKKIVSVLAAISMFLPSFAAFAANDGVDNYDADREANIEEVKERLESRIQLMSEEGADADDDGPYRTVTIPVSADTFVQRNNNVNHGSDAKIFSAANTGVASRWMMLKFDLSQLNLADTEAIMSASLYVTPATDNAANPDRISWDLYPFTIYHYEDDSWNENEIKNTPTLGKKLVMPGEMMSITDATTPSEEDIYEVDITNAVTEECYNDPNNVLSVALETAYNGTQTWGSKIYSKEADIDDIYKPHLEIVVNKEASACTVAAKKDWAVLKVGTASDCETMEVTGDLELPRTLPNGSTVEWYTYDEATGYPAQSDAFIATDMSPDKPLGQVTFPKYEAGEQQTTLIAIVTNENEEGDYDWYEKYFKFNIKPIITPEILIGLEKDEIVKQFDKKTAGAKLDFYTEGVIKDSNGNLSGVKISWDSKNKDVISDTGVVSAPDNGATVPVTVTLSKDDVEYSFDITIYVAKTSKAYREAAYSSLQEVTKYCEEYVTTLHDDGETGAVTTQNKQAFEAAIAAAKELCDNENASHAEYDSAINALLGTGLSLFSNMVLDNSLIPGTQDNERVFSQYRAKVMSLVFEGEMLIRTYPDLYTDGDRFELRDKIDYAKALLDGTQKRMFNRNREFIRPREDEMLQRMIEDNYKAGGSGRVYGYGESARFDLAQTIDWFRTTNVLSQAYASVDLDPVIDGEMEVSKAINTTTEGAQINNLATFRGKIHPSAKNGDKVYIAQFNYGELNSVVSGFTLGITNNRNDRYDTSYEILKDEYDEKVKAGVKLSDLTENEFVDNTSAVAEGDESALVENKIASSYTANSKMVARDQRQVVDLSKAAQVDKNGLLTIIIRETNYDQNWPNGIYTSNYKANPDFRPKLTVKTSDVDMSQLEKNIDYLKDRYETFVKWYEPGTGLGKVDSGKYKAAQDAVAAVDDAWEKLDEAYIIGTKIVDAYNAMRDARQSMTLLSDIDEDCNIFMSSDAARELKSAILKDTDKTSVYNDMKKSADSSSIDAYREQLPLLGKANYEGMGLTPTEGMFNEKGDVSVQYVRDHFKYSASSKMASTAPDNAVTMKIELNLPAGEYTGLGEGQGCVWFDNITGEGQNTKLDIKNPSFESGQTSPDNWTFVTKGSGNSEFKLETARNLVQAGSRSAYLENKDADAEASLVSDAISVKGGERYTVTMNARLDRVLQGKRDELEAKGDRIRFANSGVRMIYHWYDASGNEITTNTLWHNKRCGTGPLSNQADAIVYFMTGDKAYAEKAKYGILLKLNDIAQGTEEWTMTTSRPNDVDAYGGVQIGRNLCTLAQSYSLIKDSGVFNEYEQKLYESLLAANIRFMAEYRDRSEKTPSELIAGGNWATDTWAGTALSCMAFPEYKGARQMIDNAHYLLTSQIDNAIGENGTYPESTRYMWAGVSKFSLYAYCDSAYSGLKNIEKTYLGNLFNFAVDIQAPYFDYLKRASNPNFGDNTLRDGSFGIAASYLDQINKVNPSAAQAIYKSWENQGKPTPSWSAEEPAFPSLLVPMEFKPQAGYKLDLKSQWDYPESMGPIFRQNVGVANKEVYVALNAPQRGVAHMHYDLGSIIFYANSEPMLMDPGVESYFDATTLSWYKNSPAHSVLQFGSNGNWENVPDPSAKQAQVKDFVTNSEIDYTKANIPQNSGTQIRNVAYLKGSVNALVVWDDVDSTKAARTNWGTPAKSVKIEGNKYISTGHFNTDLETTILPEEDSSRKMSTFWGRMVAGSWPDITVDGEKGTYINMEYTEQAAGKDFFAVHYPKEKTAKGTLEATTLKQENDLSIYKLKAPSSVYVLACTNGGTREGSIALEEGVTYDDLITGEKVSGSVSLAGGEMKFLQPDSFEKARPNSIQITGASAVASSDTVDVTSAYQASVIDQYGAVMSDQSVEWSVSGSGASISQTGELTVKAGIQNGDITITAKTGDISESFKVSVSKASRLRSSIEIKGTPFIAYEGKALNVNYSAEVYDQFGQIYNNDKVQWSISGDEGFTVSQSGVLSVAANLENGASATITVKSVYNEFITNSIKVTVGESTPSSIKVKNEVSSIALPSKGKLSLSFAGEVVDQSGNAVTDGKYSELEYEISAPPSIKDYISVNNKGDISISAVPSDVIAAVSGQTITVTISSKADSNIKAQIPLTIKSMMISRLEISGSSSITAPEKGTDTFNYTVKAYDQNGEAVNNYNKLKWSISNCLTGLYIDNGKLTVTSYAASGTAVIKVTDTEDGSSAEINVAISKAQPEKPDNGNKETVSGGGGGGAGGGSGNAFGDYSNRLPSLPADSALPPTNGGEQKDGLFDDLPMSHWAADAVYKLRDSGIIYGRSDRMFAPSENVTRAEFASMLVRAFDIKGTGIASKFEDVTMNDWFYDAVSVCVEHKIVSGVDVAHFMPNDVITRQDMCVMLYHTFKTLGIDTGALEELSFNDKSEISEYALEAVSGMTADGILSGYEDKTFRPKNNASRAEAAKVIYGAVNKLEEE